MRDTINRSFSIMPIRWCTGTTGKRRMSLMSTEDARLPALLFKTPTLQKASKATPKRSFSRPKTHSRQNGACEGRLLRYEKIKANAEKSTHTLRLV